MQATELNLPRQRIETDRKNYEDLLQRLRQAEVESDFRPSNIRIVQAAEIPIAPVKPNKILNMGFEPDDWSCARHRPGFLHRISPTTLSTMPRMERITQLPSSVRSLR
ncbi:MAG: hypothetical protein IPG76_21650 [Acidobacteria bacterium]|nr:hypothetical protein [Acidobacteriota bacterium]